MSDELDKRTANAGAAVFHVGDKSANTHVLTSDNGFQRHIAVLVDDAFDFFECFGGVHGFMRQLGISLSTSACRSSA